MICYSREGAAEVNTFELLGTALEKRRAGLISKRFAMHCDLVVLSDDKGDSKLKSMGGNVVQSVTLRKMNLNGEKTINTNYIASTNPKICIDTENCLGNLNLKPWAVLLQFRTQ